MVATPKPGDVVWAKLKGYRWWPAKIEDELGLSEKVLKSKPKKKFTVIPIFFFGSSDYAWLGYDSILPFLDNYDRLSIDPSKPHLFRKSLDGANKDLGRFTETSEEDLQNTRNLSDVEKFLEQAEPLSTPHKKKRGRPTKTSEASRVIKKEIKFNKIPTSSQIKRDDTSINNGHDSTSGELSKSADSSEKDNSEKIFFIDEELEVTEDSGAQATKISVQKRVKNNIRGSKKITTTVLNSEVSSSDLDKIDSRNGLKKRGRPAKNVPIQTKKRGRPSKSKIDIEPSKELSKNTENTDLRSDSLNLVENTDDVNDREEFVNPLASIPPSKAHQMNGSEFKDSLDRAAGSNSLNNLNGSENEALKSRDQPNTPTLSNQDLEKLKESNSRPLLDTPDNVNPDGASRKEKEATTITQETSSLEKASVIIEADCISTHIPKSSELFKTLKPSIDMCQLRHELQKFAITEKMKNRPKLESTLSKLESSSPTVDDLTKSKIIKVFRHIIRSKVADSNDRILVQCKNLYKRFKAILDEENDKKDLESQDNNILFNPDTSILTSNSVC